MEEYDKAWAKYQEKLKIVPTPLICWEFRKEYLSETVVFKKFEQNWDTKINFLEISKSQKKEVVITDKNFKIVFASHTISKMNGYHPDEMIGNYPKMLQGEKTSSETRHSIKKALEDLKPFKEVILNYKKNGEPYWCEIEAFPMFDKKGTFINYIALEKLAS